MGIADFFLGKKGESFSVNDLSTASRASTPNIIGPGFRTSIRNVRAPGTVQGVPQTRQEISILEDPSIRSARESQQGLASALSGNLAGFGFGAPIAADEERRAEVEQATFDRALNLLQPGIDRRRRQGVQGLSDRGLPAGSDARRIGLEELRDAEQFQLENLALSSVGAGEQALTSDVNRQIASRQQILSQIAQLLAPQTGVPNVIPSPSLSGGDILAPSAQAGAGLAARNAQQGQLLGALLGAAGQVGGAAALRPGGGPA